MKITKYTVKLLLVSLFSIVASCDDIKFGDGFLELPPNTDTNIKDVYSSEINAMQALTQVYKSLPDGFTKPSKSFASNLLESITDLSHETKGWGPIRDTYYTGLINASSWADNHKYAFIQGGGWDGIRDGWLFINNVDQVPDMSPEDKILRKAEARLIIGIHYADMLRHFGGLPWVGKTYTPNEAFNFPRMTFEETVNKTIELIDEAAKDLPWTVSAADDGRMTKIGALAIKVRVLLFAASPLYNDDKPFMDGETATSFVTWYGNKDSKRWDRALAACEEFMTELDKNGVYQLVDTGNPREDFRRAYFDRANNEVLISTRRVTRHAIWSGTIENCLYGNSNTTLECVDMYPWIDGSDFDWTNQVHAKNPFFDQVGNMNRDPRLYETVLINGDYYQGRKAETFIGGRERPDNRREGTLCASGFCMRKFRLDGLETRDRFYSWPHIRLAEVFLSYAEVLNECGRTDEAYKYLNMTKTRVDMPLVEGSHSKGEFRELVLKERAMEFVYEEVRFFDLIRWKRDDILRQKPKGLDIKKDVTGNFIYTPFELIPSRAWQGDGWNGKWYLSPIQQEEIDKQYGLIQNPGW